MGKKQQIYILAGSPGSGKSWIAGQLKDKFKYVAHDTHGIESNEKFVKAIASEARNQQKPVLTDTPFSLSKIQKPLETMGFTVHPIFIIETKELTQKRYEDRHKSTGKGQPKIPKQHLSRIDSFLDMAANSGAPNGTSSEMLKYLKDLAV